MRTLQYAYVDSPIGRLLLVGEGQELWRLEFVESESLAWQADYADQQLLEVDDPNGWCSLLQAYFAGDFSGLNSWRVRPQGTAFQQRVWTLLQTIPVGHVRSYGDLAASLGDPKASRAVGMANALNPIAIIIPCHRVIGASGQLTGYAGGLERKRWLLQHEGALLL